MNKASLRKLYRSKRIALTENEVDELSYQIFENIKIHLPNILESKGVHIFLPIVRLNEIDTWYIIKWLWENNVSTWAPKVKGEEILNLPLYPSTRLTISRWDIPEPSFDSYSKIPNCTIDTVLCPLLYCDHSGHRIGYGKGFYDRLLSKFPKIKKIGLNYFEPKEEISGMLCKDIRMDYLITPFGLKSFTS